MRAVIMSLAFLASLGAIMSTEQIVADEKKEKEFEPLPKGFKFNEEVTVKWWNKGAGKFIETKEKVAAFRFAGSKGKCFYLKTKDVGAVKILPDSEIVDADGFTYVVTESPTTSEDVLVRVKNKP